MKNLTFYGDVAKALKGTQKKFELKQSLKGKFFKNLKKHKIALIVTILSLIFPVSGFINVLLSLVSIVGGIKCLKGIGLETIKDVLKEEKEIKKEVKEAKTVLHRFNGNALKYNGINLSENNFSNSMKNIGTYSKKEVTSDIRIKKEKETINTYIKMKDTRGRIHVLKQIKEQLLEDGEVIKELSPEYQLLNLKEADLQLKKEKGKIR